jgi:hypothetical protein
MAHRAGRSIWPPGEKPEPCEFTEQDEARFRTEWNQWYNEYRRRQWHDKLAQVLGREPTNAEMNTTPKWIKATRKVEANAQATPFSKSDFHMDFDNDLAQLLGMRPKINDGRCRIFVVTSNGFVLMSKYADKNGDYLRMSPDYSLFKASKVAPESKYDKHYPGRRRNAGVVHVFIAAPRRVKMPEGFMFEVVDTEVTPNVPIRFNTRYDSYNGDSPYGEHFFQVPTVAKWKKPQPKKRPRMVKCKECNGLGWLDTKLTVVPCHRCDNNGTVRFSRS